MALWPEVALRQMRRDGAYSYIDSYSRNDDEIWGRDRRNSDGTRNRSSQSTRASLIQGKYATPTAWTTTNPDYTTELSWMSQSSPFRTQQWGRVLQWNHIYMGTTYKDNHLPGFINNTRVMIFGSEVWVKSKATGLWRLAGESNNSTGEWWSPDFVTFNGYYENTPNNYRIEAATGYPSILPYRAAHGSDRIWHTDANYWLWHGYTLMRDIDGPDVADVISMCKVSLVVNDATQADDRDKSRYLFAVGADYYPASGSLSTYPGIGTARHTFVTAKWPNWQWSVMHTMTEAQFNATGGYPSELANRSEGTTVVTPPGGGGGVVTPPPPVAAPTRGTWFTKTVSTKAAWNSKAVSNAAPTTVRRGGRSKLR